MTKPMTTIKEKDFIEIDYIGKIKDTNQIFDLTDKETAVKHNLFDPKFKYGSRIICVGEKEILPGIDRELIGKEIPSKLTITIKPAEAFGIRNEKLMKIVPTDVLLKQNINPYPGLQITASGMMGTIRTVSRGRTIVDFNHPLAGKELIYEIEIKSLVTNADKQLTNLFENAFHLSTGQYAIQYHEKKATISIKGVKIPKELLEIFEKKASSLLNLEVKFAN
jgi:FKBP-type peptidyl-prolyl cis-trans isomerase 2